VVLYEGSTGKVVCQINPGALRPHHATDVLAIEKCLDHRGMAVITATQPVLVAAVLIVSGGGGPNYSRGLAAYPVG
jgi:hypothetical protein